MKNDADTPKGDISKNRLVLRNGLFASRFNETLQYLSNISNLILKTVKEAAEITNSYLSFIFFSDPDLKEIKQITANLPSNRVKDIITPDSPLVRAAAKKKASFTISSGPELPNGIISAAVAPITSLAENQIIGYFFFLSKEKEFKSDDLALIESIAKETGLAADNLNKIEIRALTDMFQAQASEKYHEYFSKIGEAFSSATDLNQILNSIAEICLDFTCADSVSVSLVEKDKIIRQVYSSSCKNTSDISNLARQNGIIGWKTGNIKCYTSFEIEKNHNNAACYYIGIPILHKDEITASVNIYFNSGNVNLTSEQITILESIAKQAGLAIENARNYETEQKRIREASVLYEGVRAVSQATTIEELMSVTIQKMSQIAQVNKCAVFLYEKERHLFVFASASEVTKSQLIKIRNFQLSSDEIDPDIWNSFTCGNPHIIKLGSIPSSLALRQLLRILTPVGDALIMPLIAREKIIGAVYLYDSKFSTHFSSYQIDLLKTISMQISIALQRIKLMTTQEEQTQQLKALLNISSMLPSARSVNKIMRIIVEKSLSLRHVNASAIIYINDSTQDISVKTTKNLKAKLAESSLQIKIAKTAIKTNKAILSLEPGKISDADLKMELKDNLSHIISIPFISKRKYIGALNLFSKQGELFHKNDIKFFKSFAEQAASAIRNADHEANMKNKMRELAILFESSKSLNSSLNRDMVLDIIANQMMRHTNSDAISVMLVEEKNHAFGYEKDLYVTMSIGLTKTYEKRRFNINKRLIKEVILAGQHIMKTYSGIGDKDFPELLLNVGIKTILAVPMEHRGKIIGILNVYRKIPWSYAESEISLLSILANMAASAIENAQMFENQRAVANILQSIVMPLKEYKFPEVEIGYKYIPSGDISGDYFDLINLDKKRFSIVIADVSGKGHSAAIYTVRVKYLLKAYALAGYSPSEILNKVNLSILPETGSEKFISLFYVEINTDEKTIKYSSAGHEPALIYNSEEGKSELLSTEGMLIGITNGVVYQQKERNYKSGDILTLYTDGITESVNEHNEQFGISKINTIIEKNAGKPAQFIANSIYSAVQKYTKRKLHDDFSLLTLKL